MRRDSTSLSHADIEHVLAATENLWHELRGERLFITGGTGFIGCWLLETFLAARTRFALDASAVVLTRDPGRFIERAPHLATHGAIGLLRGDVRSFKFPAGEFSFIIHGATDARAHLNAERPLEMFDVIVAGTRRVLEFARTCGGRKFLLLSSGAVYGTQPWDVSSVDEAFGGAPDPLRAESAYGEGKRGAELLCAMHSRMNSSLQVKIARCFAFVGPYLPLNEHFAIGNFIRDALAGGPIEVNGDGTPRRSYLYGADLAVWLWKILFHAEPLRAYNVGSAHASSVLDVARLVAAAFDPPPRITVAKTTPPPHPARYVPSVARAEAELDLHQWISCEEAIARTIEWHVDRGQAKARR